MLIIAALMTVLCGLIALVWLTRYIAISRERRGGMMLRDDYRGSSSQRPHINVLVAAKDEEENIERCVRTMLEQDYGNFDLTVCDDRSTDRTGEIVARLAEQDQRLRLVTIQHLPEGWAGKNHAMHNGISRTRGEWLCMIDADCWQVSRRSLSAAAAYALDTRSDLLSVLPTQEFKGFWENVVQPICSGLMMIWFHPDKVNDPRKPNAYANGAFMLMRREAYDKIGGHEAVRACVNEDMHIAARVKQAGMNLRVVRNDGMYSLRMYNSLRGIYRGWSRIFYGTFGTFKRIGLSLLALLVVSMLPYAAAALGLALAAAGTEPRAWWIACAAAASTAVVAQLVTIFRFYRLIHARPWLTWTYLLGCVITMCCLLSALGKLRKGAKIVWRNTSYSSDHAAKRT
jgi:cellulose synthase/poly-beta-1,6-N-acetylglucosamine synthase-like glycosyltransferase